MTPAKMIKFLLFKVQPRLVLSHRVVSACLIDKCFHGTPLQSLPISQKNWSWKPDILHKQSFFITCEEPTAILAVTPLREKMQK